MVNKRMVELTETICDKCGALIENNMPYHAGHNDCLDLCGDCYRKTATCDYCGDTFFKTEMFFELLHDEYICKNCLPHMMHDYKNVIDAAKLWKEKYKD